MPVPAMKALGTGISRRTTRLTPGAAPRNHARGRGRPVVAKGPLARYRPAMRRVAHVLLVVLLVLGMPSQWVPAFFGDGPVAAQGDCCPDDGSGDEADCCDWD